MDTSYAQKIMSNEDKDIDVSSGGDVQQEACASCGKEGNSSDMNTCNKCDLVQYCNAACKKRHRSKHKVACEKRIAKLHEEELERERCVTELHDEKLFKQPPPNEDCPICMLRLSSLHTGYKYRYCCGKVICSGCIYAQFIRDRKNAPICPFCRLMPRTGEEIMQNFMKLVEANDADSMTELGCCYATEEQSEGRCCNKNVVTRG